MSDQDRPRGGRGRAGGSRLRVRVTRNVSPGRPPVGEGSVQERSSVSESPTSQLQQLQLQAPRRGGSVERSGEPTRGVVRGPHHEGGGKRGNTITRPSQLVSKQGKLGQRVDLLTNFYVLWKATAWSLRQHRVDFDPPLDAVGVRGAMIRQHAEKLGGYSYDKGSIIYTSHELPSDPMVLESVDQKDVSKKYTIVIRFVAAIEPGDTMNVMFYNTTLRRCLFNMGLEELGRGFYDSSQEKVLSQYRLKLWPGFKTSIRNHENNVLLCVETTHKVLRMDNVMVTMEEVRSKLRGGDERQACADEIVGTVVMTPYNKKTYSVSDIAWNLTPASTFTLRNNQSISYADYYKERYNLSVTNMRQPLLLTVAKKRDYHRGANRDEAPTPVYLVPEFCQMTGLTDGMRSNNFLMKELSKYLHEGPAGRIETLKKFIKRLRETSANKDYLQKWGLEFKDNLVSCQGRIMDPESIIFAGDQPEPIDKLKADWTMAFRKRQMLTTIKLENWSMIVSQRDNGPNLENLIQTMIKVSRPLGFQISKPNVVTIPDTRVNTYIKAIQEQSKRKDIQLLFIILANNNVGTYGAIKKKLSADIGLPSQCFLAKNITNKGLMSICTKVVIQMNVKLGGEAWTVKIPLKKMMTVGFDVYHGGKVTGGKNVGALVASVTPSHASFYSTVSFFSSTDEMSRNLCSDLIKSIEAYAEINNNELPERILFYRDGVGDGQLELIINTELSQVRSALDTIYSSRQQPVPKLTFVIVSKKINTRLFKIGRNEAENPPPGTVCDNEVTLPERYDFFLIPQTARQGAVSPTSFNVLFDSQNLDPDKIQRLTYKMCHLYFNWSGTVAVPAPCQYAHKLAHQTGIAIGDHSHQQLSYLLHFL